MESQWLDLSRAANHGWRDSQEDQQLQGTLGQ